MSYIYAHYIFQLKMEVKMQNNNMKIISVYGLGLDALVEKEQRIFTGVSMLYPFYNDSLNSEKEFFKNRLPKKDLNSICQWATERFKEHYLIVGDSIINYNFVGFYDMKKEKALEKAYEISRYWYDHCVELAKLSPKIKVLRWSELTKNKEFTKFIETGKNYANKNSTYKGACELFTLISAQRPFKLALEKKENFDFEKVLEICGEYSDEVASGFFWIYENLSRISVTKQPPLPIVKAVYGGHYPELYKTLNLTDFGHIQLAKEGKKIFCDGDLKAVYDLIKQSSLSQNEQK